ncbi:MAG: response regulator [Candidatus Solibacter usitatus]|nr:response regulator [Candidatus Solibacter usitatus]
MPRLSLSTLLSALLAMQCWTAAGQSAGGLPKRNVLILNSYHAGLEWTDEVGRGFRSVMNDQPFEVEIWTEFLDTKRHFEPGYFAEIRCWLALKYAGTRLDLIVSVDDDALAFLLEHKPSLFGGVPVVFCGVSGKQLIASAPRDSYTGIEEELNVRSLVDEATRLFPRARRVYVVADNSATSAAHLAQLRQLAGEIPALQFEFLDGAQLPFETLLDRLRAAPADSVVLATMFTHDHQGDYIPERVSSARIAQASPAPVFSPNTSSLGQGYLSGNRDQGFDHGRLAARMAVQVLNGQAPSAIPLAVQGGLSLLVDHDVMKRWGLDESGLPPGTEVVNAPASLVEIYHQNRLAVWTGAAFLLAQSLIIAALILNRRKLRRAETELLESRANLDRAQAVAHLGAFERDLASGRMLWSDETYRLYGLAPGSVEPSLDLVLSLIHPDDRERMRAIVQLPGADRRGGSLEYRVIRSDGVTRHLRSEREIVTTPDGRQVMTGIVQDITDLREVEEQFLHAQRVESLGTLAGGIAHDFNNLLTVINGYAEMLLAQTGEQQPLYQPLMEISHAGSRAADLTSQLLAFSRRQVLRPRVLDLNHVALSMEGLLKPLLGDSVQLNYSLAPGLLRVRLDKGQIENAILNLAANARDAMPGGGALTIATADEDVSERTSWHGFEIHPGPHVSLSVSDTGAGMSEATRERIFEPFFTTKEMGKGTGLGLSSVYGSVKQSGGHLHVVSAPGEGATFNLLFPATDEQPEASGQAAVIASAERSEAACAAAIRILLVDDDLQVLNMAAAALEASGYSVLRASSAKEALQIAAAGPPHLLITDLVMPGTGGRALSAELCGRYPGLPVLYVSGYAAELHHPGRDSAHVEFLPKPFQPQKLREAVGRLLGLRPI